mgnify:CR=1 FL=1|jgi:hypothetical protein
MIKQVLQTVAFFLLGALIAGLAVWGVQRVQIAELKSERDSAVLAKEVFQEKWEVAVNELNATRVLLSDTLAALELLREYQKIDQETRNDIDELDNTLDTEGNPTEDTYDSFRRMVEEFNRLQGTMVTGSGTPDVLDIQPFVELKEDAEKLFREATDLLLVFRGE